MKRFWTYFIVFDFYLSALLFLVAGFIKMNEVGVGELLETLYELDIFNPALILYGSRLQPYLEIGVALWAFVGWQAKYVARFMGLLYLFFAVLILVASQGFLMDPIDCGCFGPSEGLPVIVLLCRNLLLALPLFFFHNKHQRFTLFHFYQA
jgi:hypothetical protein